MAKGRRRRFSALQLGDAGQHVVAHVEFVPAAPLDPVVDPLVDLGRDAAIEHEDAIADKPPNLLVVKPDALGIHPVFPQPVQSGERSRGWCIRSNATHYATARKEGEGLTSRELA